MTRCFASLAAARLPTIVIEQQLPSLADPDGELRKLGGARGRDLPVLHEALLEGMPPAVHVERERRGHWQIEVAHEDRRQPPHGRLV